MHQPQSAVRCSASRMGVEFILPRTTCEVDFCTLCVLSSVWMNGEVSCTLPPRQKFPCAGVRQLLWKQTYPLGCRMEHFLYFQRGVSTRDARNTIFRVPLICSNVLTRLLNKPIHTNLQDRGRGRGDAMTML